MTSLHVSPASRWTRVWPALLLPLWLAPQLSTGHAATLSNTNAPTEVVRLFFIHHSTGENWLNDEHGGLGPALRDSNYFVSDSNYGWGPEGIGDTTDIGNWHSWFRGPDSATYLAAVFAAGEQNCWYSRLEESPAGLNQILLFKSCFPNSALQGAAGDPIPAIGGNPLKGQDAYSEYHTVANAKGIYLDLLPCFASRTNTLFVAVTAPPLSDPTWADNARAFNQWLMNDWLAGYPHANVFVFDFYNVLTSNGGATDVSDVGRAAGNHHRWWEGALQHKTDGGGNVLAYPSSPDDDHPNGVGSQKATAEFVPLLNAAYHAWQASLTGSPAAPGFEQVAISPTEVQLSIRDLSAGVSYVLERNTSLASEGWVQVATLSGVTSTNWSEPFRGQDGAVFYRLRSE